MLCAHWRAGLIIALAATGVSLLLWLLDSFGEAGTQEFPFPSRKRMRCAYALTTS